MTIMAICAAMLLLGLVFGARWAALPFSPPPASATLAGAEVARRFAWYAALTFAAGIPAGLTVIGGGGRLAMRLLAVTADDAAQGRITEAHEVVGEITTGGTIGFVLFNGIFGGVLATAVYLLVRRYLPQGRLGGLAFGLGLLAVFGATIDPLRAENPDFDIVGPGWVAVLVFTAMALGFGIAVQGFTARMSTWLPPLSTERRVLLRWALPAAFALLAFSVTAVLLLVCVVVVLVTRWQPTLAAVRSPRWILAGRILLAAVVLVSTPNTISNVTDIVTG